MRTPDLQIVEDIARKARIDIMQNKVSPRLMAGLFANQYGLSPTEALREYRVVQRMFPDSCCAFASLYIQHQAKVGEIADWYYNEYEHTVLNLGATVLGKITILDTTADQFGGPAFYLGPLRAPWAK